MASSPTPRSTSAGAPLESAPSSPWPDSLATPPLKNHAHRALAAIDTPTAIAGEGKWIGGFLLALDEAGAFPWPMP